MFPVPFLLYGGVIKENQDFKFQTIKVCLAGPSSIYLRVCCLKNPFSWADGCALAALISKYNPDFTTSVPITSNNPAAILCSESFEYAEKHLGIPRPCQTQYEWAIMNEQDRIEYLEKLAGVLRANPYYATNCMSPTLLRNFNQNRALECAIQARIFRPKKYMEANDSVFDFNTLESTENVTVRSKKPKLDSIAIQNVRRSSIEPLNPELVFKVGIWCVLVSYLDCCRSTNFLPTAMFELANQINFGQQASC